MTEKGRSVGEILLKAAEKGTYCFFLFFTLSIYFYSLYKCIHLYSIDLTFILLSIFIFTHFNENAHAHAHYQAVVIAHTNVHARIAQVKRM